MPDADRRERAIELWQQAYACQMRKELDEAVELYQESLALFPTAEAHTFLGWTYSFQGRLDEAIAECRKAIALDPDFGNPYNDIGVYLIERGDLQRGHPVAGAGQTRATLRAAALPVSESGPNLPSAGAVARGAARTGSRGAPRARRSGDAQDAPRASRAF